MRSAAASKVCVIALLWIVTGGCQLLSGVDQLEVKGSDAGPVVDARAEADVVAHMDTGVDGGRGRDAGTDAGGDTGTDAGADVRVDTGLKSDAGTDAGVDWCASQDAGYRVCSDFDLTTGSVTQGFDIGLVPVAGGAGGNFTLDTSVFVSPPNAALGVANPYPKDGTSGINLDATLWPTGSTPTTVHCSAVWNPRKLSTITNDYAHVIDMVLFDDKTESKQIVYLGINMNGDGTIEVLEYYPTGGAGNHVIPYTVPTDEWLPIDLSFTTSSGVTSFRASVDGTAVSGPLLLPFPATSYAILEIGPAYYAGSNVAPSPGWTFDYDNVICY